MFWRMKVVSDLQYWHFYSEPANFWWEFKPVKMHGRFPKIDFSNKVRNFIKNRILDQSLFSTYWNVCALPPQIREQTCLETHFQYEFSILGCFGQSGWERKKNPNYRKYATFEASFFLMFSWAKNILKFSWKYPSVRNEKLHNIDPRTILKIYIKE